MSKLSVSDKRYDDEIDLFSFIETVWNGKWKIAFIIIVFLLPTIGFHIVKPNKTFTAKTEIKTITSFDFDRYRLFNATGVFKIEIKDLLNLYIEQIEQGGLLEKGIIKFNLVNKDNFNSQIDYEYAIEKFASKIEIIKPIKEKRVIRLFHLLKIEYNDKEKWKNFIVFLNNEANKKVKVSIINRFETMVSIQQQKKDFAIKDLETKLDNAKNDFDKKMENFELKKQFKIEDLKTQIENAKKDYDKIIQKKLAFLFEQATIAKKLGIIQNTIAFQSFDTKNSIVANVSSDAPYYLRGFQAIEEEIRLIKSRKDKNSFVEIGEEDFILKLEQQKRTLEQDRTLQRAEKNKMFLETHISLQLEKRAIEQNKTLQRSIDLFKKTPLNQTDFKATIVKLAATDYNKTNKKNLAYVMAIVIGGIIGLFYVFIANERANRRKILTNS